MRIVKFTLKFLVGLMTGLILVGACVGALAIWYFGRDLPDYQQLTDYQPSIVSRVYAGDGRLLAEYATEKRVFVPVKDASAGSATYGGGRYLLDTVKGADLGGDDGRLILDLHFAYNPSCAYDSKWACPLAPPANRLDVAIRAGELDPAG